MVVSAVNPLDLNKELLDIKLVTAGLLNDVLTL